MPLPSPRVNEDLNDFIGRCVIDPNVVNDFATSDQRLAVCNSLYSQEKEIKAAKENYTAKFSEQLTKAERSSVKDFYKFYNNQYDQASAMFIRQGALSATDVSVFFKENDLINMYTEMYSKIGLHFALWYYKNVDKLLNKASDLDNLMSIWAKSFAFVGQQVGAQRVTLVSGTAKNTLISVTQKLMSDPTFMNQGEKVKAKMLKTQFNKYSTYQAKRLVRTEATNAANSATIASAQTVFEGKDLIKRWHTIMDGRERDSHGAVNGKEEPNTGKFTVQGQFLKGPGDPEGEASNVINCRCGVSVFPKPNAQTTGENITDIGFGVAQAQVQSAISEALITPEVATTIAVEAQQIQENYIAKTIDEAKEIAIKIFEKGGINIKEIELSKSFGVKKINKLNSQLNSLINEYDTNKIYNTNYKVRLKYKSGKNYLGKVTTADGNLYEVNFGDKTNSILSRTRVNNVNEIVKKGFSVVDEANLEISTLTHEFAHILVTRDTLYVDELAQITKQFYSDLSLIKKRYDDEIINYLDYDKIDDFNKNYLGKYASANIDEFMAEGFTEYKLSSKPSKYAIEIGKLIDKYFKK
jgi:hypothetical protein